VSKKCTTYSKGMKSKTDWEAVDAMSDDEIDYSEIPEQGKEFFKNAVRVNYYKQKLMPIDRSVVGWFKKQGGDFCGRINAVLKAHVEKEKAARRRRTPATGNKRKRVA
jgi:uncharacterized protein (DUF4415 family)